MKRRLVTNASFCLVCVLCLLCLTGCGQKRAAPSAVLSPSPALDALPREETSLPQSGQMTVRLYFGCQDAPYLGAEERTIRVDTHTTPEKAVVEHLIMGPSADQVSLTPLFPPDSRVISAVERDGTLFVTFNDALLSRYPGEGGGTGNENYILKRRLCMAALVNTLTECGFCSRVQVLVQQDTDALTSLRLPASFFRETEDLTPLGPMYRDETLLLTPYNTARMILNAWMTRAHDELYGFLASAGSDGSPRPGQNQMYDLFDLSPVLMNYTLSPGVLSPDGQSAVLCLDLMVSKDGQDRLITAFPLHLTEENGFWRIPHDQLESLFNTAY